MSHLHRSSPLEFNTPIGNTNNICVIGGGISALTVIERLFNLQSDLNITLYCEDSELASRASGNKQGAIYPLLQGSQSIISQLFAECYPYAVRYFSQFEHLGFEHQWCGVLQQAIKPELETRYQKVQQTWSVHCDYLSAEQSSKVAGLSLPYPSLYFKDGGWLWPQDFCSKLHEQLTNNFNLTTQLNSRITHLEKQDNVWLVDGNTYDVVIIANGHQVTQLPQTAHLSVQSVRGQVSRLNNNTKLNSLNTVLCHKGYVTPSTGHHQCFGASFIKDNEDETASTREDGQNLAQLKSVYQETEWSQALSESEIIGAKAGIRCMSTDHIPIVGEVFSDEWVQNNVNKNTGEFLRNANLTSELSGCFVMTGLGARGLTTAPMMAEYLARLILGKENELPPQLKKAIAPNRFQIRELKRNKSVKSD